MNIKVTVATIVCCLIACSTTGARADRVIVSPSATALAPDGAQAEITSSVGDHPTTETWATFGSALTEIEIGVLRKPNLDVGEVSIESQYLPETSGLPALAMGIRDLGNNTPSFAKDGYYGRGFYAVGGRKPIQLAAAPYPLRNLNYTVGCGLAGIRGPFGSVGADLPLNAHWNVEWDSREFNEKLTMNLSNYTLIEYERRAASNYIGFSLFTPTMGF